MKSNTSFFQTKGWVVLQPLYPHQGGRRWALLWACRGAAKTAALPWGLLCCHLCKREEKRRGLSPEKMWRPCWQLLPTLHSWLLVNNARHWVESHSLAVFGHFYHAYHNVYAKPGVPSTQPGKRSFTNKLESDEHSPTPPYHWAPSFQYSLLGTVSRKPPRSEQEKLENLCSNDKIAISR